MTYYKGIKSYGSIRNKLIAALPLSTCFLAYAYASGRPEMTEELYSRGYYPIISSAIARVTSLFSFSIAEFLVYIAAFFIIVRLVRGLVWFLYERSAAGRIYYLLDMIMSGVVFFAAVCFLFITLWGLNYNRLTFAESSGLDAAPAPVSALERSALLLVMETNSLREIVKEDDDGVMALSVPLRNTLTRANEGYRSAATEFDALDGFEPGRPKPVLASRIMSYAGITGVYFPITAEANINTDITDAELPFTICHELAHQLGYSREDEASFISWVACMYSPYEDYRYSGSLMALVHLLNALRERDTVAWGKARGMCSPAVNGDLNAMGQYWRLYEGPVSEVSESINDAFLRANKQEDGVQSYGRMVDLVIAYLAAGEPG